MFAHNSCHMSKMMLPPSKNTWLHPSFTGPWQSRKGVGWLQPHNTRHGKTGWFFGIPQHGNVLWPSLEEHKVLGFPSGGGGLWSVLSPWAGPPSSPQHSTAPTYQALSHLISRDTPSPLSRYLIFMEICFALHWRFLGSDLDRPLFLSNMFCQIPSEISFIHSSSLTQRAPHHAGDHHRFMAFLCPFPCFPPCPHVPLVPAPVWPQPSRSPCGSPEGSAAACPRCNTAGMFTVGKVTLFPRKTSFFLFDYFFLNIPTSKWQSHLFYFLSLLPFLLFPSSFLPLFP